MSIVYLSIGSYCFGRELGWNNPESLDGVGLSSSRFPMVDPAHLSQSQTSVASHSMLAGATQ